MERVSAVFQMYPTFPLLLKPLEVGVWLPFKPLNQFTSFKFKGWVLFLKQLFQRFFPINLWRCNTNMWISYRPICLPELIVLSDILIHYFMLCIFLCCVVCIHVAQFHAIIFTSSTYQLKSYNIKNHISMMRICFCVSPTTWIIG